ncbi:MAG TPA: hypothetical protein VNV86_20405 [Candidatus Acidoferrum sp.]|jgi:hypothetical protein|nr:hypothetical protein [Candidatus Acidoferrum sp.]
MDWANLAKAQGLDLSEQETDRIAQALGALEQTFQPLTANLPADLEPASEFHMEEE